MENFEKRVSDKDLLTHTTSKQNPFVAALNGGGDIKPGKDDIRFVRAGNRGFYALRNWNTNGFDYVSENDVDSVDGNAKLFRNYSGKELNIYSAEQINNLTENEIPNIDFRMEGLCCISQQKVEPALSQTDFRRGRRYWACRVERSD